MFDADALNKTTILSGGADPIDMAARLKFCKAAKLVPAKIRTPRADERDPQVEAVHAVVILLAAMIGGPQTRTPTSVVNLWRLPFAETTGKFAKPEPRTPPVTF